MTAIAGLGVVAVGAALVLASTTEVATRDRIGVALIGGILIGAGLFVLVTAARR